MMMIYYYYQWRFGGVGSDIGRINEVTLRRPGYYWDGWPYQRSTPVREIYLGLTNHPGQLSLTISP